MARRAASLSPEERNVRYMAMDGAAWIRSRIGNLSIADGTTHRLF
jgi:hypothetical protein